MKHVAFYLAFVVTCWTLTEAYRHYQPRQCVDCWGRVRRTGDVYFDGCNACICVRSSRWRQGRRRSMCLKQMCRYNKCYIRLGSPWAYVFDEFEDNN